MCCNIHIYIIFIHIVGPLLGDTEVRAAAMAMGSKDVEENSQEPVEVVMRPYQNPETKYKDMESIEARYGNAGGLMLQEAVFEDTGATGQHVNITQCHYHEGTTSSERLFHVFPYAI